MRHRVLRSITVVLVALALIYVLLCAVVILVGGRSSRLAPSAVRMAKEAQRTAASFEYRPLSMDVVASEGQDGIAGIADAMMIAAPPRVLGPGRAEKAPDVGPALEEALRFIAAIGTGSAAEYARWRESTGARFVDAFPTGGVRAVEWYREPYEALIGKPFDASAGPRAYFDTLFERFFGQSGGALRPVDVAQSPESIRVYLYLARHFGDHIGHDPALDEGLGREFWEGGTGGAGTSFWEYPVGCEEVLLRDGETWMCMVSLVVRTEQRLAIPMQMYLFQDPRAGAWRLFGWTMSNVDRDAGVTDAVVVAPVF